MQAFDVERDIDSAPELVETVKELQARISGLEDTVESLEAELEEERQARRDAEARMEALGMGMESVNDEIAELEDRLETDSEGGTPGPDGQQGQVSTPEFQTPLEHVVSLPEHVVAEQLTENQNRARFIAKDIRDYSEKVPAGRSIDSSSLRRVLTARDGGTAHTQTVTRVMEFLDRLGKDGVKVVKRRGKRRVVFTEELVERLEAAVAMDSSGNRGGITGVVIGES